LPRKEFAADHAASPELSSPQLARRADRPCLGAALGFGFRSQWEGRLCRPPSAYPSRPPLPIAPVPQDTRSIPICNDLKSAWTPWRFTIAPGNFAVELAAERVALGSPCLQHQAELPQDGLWRTAVSLSPGSRGCLRDQDAALTG